MLQYVVYRFIIMWNLEICWICGELDCFSFTSPERGIPLKKCLKMLTHQFDTCILFPPPPKQMSFELFGIISAILMHDASCS